MGNDFGLSNYPDKWELTTLGGLLDSTGGSVQTGPFGSQLHAADYVADGIPSVMPKNISIEGILEEDIARITSKDAQRLSKYLLLDGDVIYSRRGDVEKCALVKPEEAGWLCGTGCLRVRLGEKSTISPNFLHAYLSSPALREWISRNAIGATMPNLNTSILRDVPVLVPESKDIDFIANNWELLNKKIELNRQTNETLEKMAQALFKSWFVDFDPVIDNALEAGNTIPDDLQDRAERRQQQLAKPDHQPLPDAIRQLFPGEFELTEALGWVPVGWKSSNVGSCFFVVMGQSPPGSTYNKSGSGLPFFQGKTDFGFRFPSNRIYCSAPKRFANKGDTLISVRAPVGDINVALEDCCIGRGVAATRHKSNSEPYTYYAMNQLRGHFKVFEGEGTVFGSINQKDFNALPQIEVEAKVIALFDELVGPSDKKILLNSEEVLALTMLRDTLLPKLISGELRLPSEASADAEQQPADATS